jgi:hypothetical protein
MKDWTVSYFRSGLNASSILEAHQRCLSDTTIAEVEDTV